MLVGCSYVNTVEEVPGRVEHPDAVERMLKETGFRCDVVALRDDKTESAATRENITAGLWWLAAGVKEGDSVFFSFSGQALVFPDQGSGSRTSHALCCEDYRQSGPINTADLRETLFNRLPPHCWVTLLIDLHHGGNIAPLPYTMMTTDVNEKVSLLSEEDLTKPEYPSLDIDIICVSGSHPKHSNNRTLTDAFVKFMHQVGGMTTYRAVLEGTKKLLNAGQNVVIQTSKRKSLDDTFCLGPRSDEAFLERRTARRCDVREVLDAAYNDNGSAARLVADMLGAKQRTTHSQIRTFLSDGLESLQTEVAELAKAMQQRKESDQTRDTLLDTKHTEERKTEQENENKWRALMQQMLDHEDTERKGEADRRAQRIEAASIVASEERDTLTLEKMRFVEKRRAERVSQRERWEQTITNLKRVKEVAVRPREDILLMVERKNMESQQAIDEVHRAREQKRLAEDTKKNHVAAPPLDPAVVRAVVAAQAERYMQNFAAAELDAVTFALLDSRDFKRMGIEEVGVRIRLVNEGKRMKEYANINPLATPQSIEGILLSQFQPAQ